VMVNFFSGFINEEFRNAERVQAKEREAAVNDYLAKQKAAGKDVQYVDAESIQEQWMARIPKPPLKSLIDHIDHIAKTAGVEHVGLGSDFDGVSGALPEGIHSAADLPKITQALLDRGYSDADVKKILGGNLLRVMREVEQVSQRMQRTSQAAN
jgi:membrane dipeptidase